VLLGCIHLQCHPLLQSVCSELLWSRENGFFESFAGVFKDRPEDDDRVLARFDLEWCGVPLLACRDGKTAIDSPKAEFRLHDNDVVRCLFSED
jgi:hypothetical protein